MTGWTIQILVAPVAVAVGVVLGALVMPEARTVCPAPGDLAIRSGPLESLHADTLEFAELCGYTFGDVPTAAVSVLSPASVEV